MREERLWLQAKESWQYAQPTEADLESASLRLRRRLRQAKAQRRRRILPRSFVGVLALLGLSSAAWAQSQAMQNKVRTLKAPIGAMRASVGSANGLIKPKLRKPPPAQPSSRGTKRNTRRSQPAASTLRSSSEKERLRSDTVSAWTAANNIAEEINPLSKPRSEDANTQSPGKRKISWQSVSGALHRGDSEKAEEALGRLAQSPDTKTQAKAILGLVQLSAGEGKCRKARTLARKIPQGEQALARHAARVIQNCRSRVGSSDSPN